MQQLDPPWAEPRPDMCRDLGRIGARDLMQVDPAFCQRRVATVGAPGFQHIGMWYGVQELDEELVVVALEQMDGNAERLLEPAETLQHAQTVRPAVNIVADHDELAAPALLAGLHDHRFE